MIKRRLFASVIPVAVSGCIPLPVSIASTAISGLSYITTGKSSTDHVISATIEEDCALANPVFGEPVCDDIDGETPYLTVAAYPGDQDDSGEPFVGFNNVDEPIGNLAAKKNAFGTTNEDRLAALARFAGDDQPVVVQGVELTREGVDRLVATRVAAAPVTNRTVASAPAVAPQIPKREVILAPLAAPKDAPKPSGTTAIEAPSVKARPVAEEMQTVTADVSVVSDRVVVESGRYLVLGSFRSLDRAEDLAGRYLDQGARILEASIEGKTWNRVALGPMSAEKAETLRSKLGLVGGKEPWDIRLSQPRQIASR